MRFLSTKTRAVLTTGAIGVASLTFSASPAVAAPPAPSGAEYMYCPDLQLGDGVFLDILPAKRPRVMKLTYSSDGTYFAHARVVEERYAVRGGPESGIHVNEYAGPRRNLVDCYHIGGGQYELTLSMPQR